MEPRVVDLEIRYSHLEKQLAELNQVVFEQQKSIDLLQQQLVSLRTRLSGLGEPMENEKPPHY
jgi:SlyX protein